MVGSWQRCTEEKLVRLNLFLLKICTTIAEQTGSLQILFSRGAAAKFLLAVLHIGDISGTRTRQETFPTDVPPAHICKA